MSVVSLKTRIHYWRMFTPLEGVQQIFSDSRKLVNMQNNLCRQNRNYALSDLSGTKMGQIRGR